MPYDNDTYNAPQSWNDIAGDFVDNGDCADWIEAIRAAMLERYSVAGAWFSRLRNQLRAYMAEYADYFNGLAIPEVYDFARRTEVLLDRLLTVENSDNPDPVGHYGAFLVPEKPVQKATYRLTSDVTVTTMVYNFLNHEKLFVDSECNYKSALSGVCKGSPPCDFMPFFRAVRKALNKLHVSPATVWGIWARYNKYQVWGGTFSDSVLAAKTIYEENRDAAVIDKVNETGIASVICNNYVDVFHPNSSTYYTTYRLEHLWIHRVNGYLPNYNMDLYVGLHWRNVTYNWDEETTDVEYSGAGSVDSVTTGYIGTCSGVDHSLGYWEIVGNDAWMEPSTEPSLGRSTATQYAFYVMPYVNFGVSGGFKFIDSQ